MQPASETCQAPAAVPYELVTDNQRLAELALTWQEARVVAVDTEFRRVNTFYQEPGLLQFATEKGTLLVDPLSITDWQPLRQLMTNPAVLKLLHSGREDMELLHRHYDLVPVNLLDSQIVISLISDQSALSYQQLVQQYLGVHIPKDETRSNWLQRPLSESQLLYAARDVHYLLQCWPLLQRELVRLGRLEWALADSRRMIADSIRELQPERIYLEVKGAWKLSKEQLLRLQKLCAYREQKAREMDLPRGRVIPSAGLLPLVEGPVTGKKDLIRLGELHGRQLRLFGDDLLKLLTAKDGAGQEELLTVPLRPLGRLENARLKKLRRRAHRVAESLGMAPEVLARRKSLEKIARGEETARVLTGWRWQELGRHLPQLEALDDESSV